MGFLGRPQTLPYKEVDGREIRADVYAGFARKGAPIAIWIHGGALAAGDRKGIRADVQLLCRALGCILISIDYRLAPATTLPEILFDVDDAVRWARANASRWGGDGDRIALVGESAGGFLALSAGARVAPPPRCIISIAGYGTLSGPLLEPSAYYLSLPIVSRSRVLGLFGVDPHPAHSARTEPLPASDTSDIAAAEAENAAYVYLRQTGTWPEWVLGSDPGPEGEALRPFEPAHHVGPTFPPTLLIHGTADTDVPFELAEQMAEALAQAGRPHEFLRLEGVDHTTRGAGLRGYLRIWGAMARFLRDGFGTHPARPSSGPR